MREKHGYLRKATVFILLALMVSAGGAYGKEKKDVSRLDKKELKRLETTRAVIETKYGNIVLRFYPDLAPNHVKSFIKLAREGFYDGTIFHRVIPGFMIQGGDPNTKGKDTRTYGSGGSGYKIKAEFSNKSHKRGILSMARGQDPDSAGSQFFIVVKDSPFLDGEYTVFGEVLEGMDVVDKIVSLPRDSNDLPRERVEIKIEIAKGKRSILSF
jgi:peptidyl-prolyl cis-trans isomerase B (cyclophilin B)